MFVLLRKTNTRKIIVLLNFRKILDIPIPIACEFRFTGPGFRVSRNAHRKKHPSVKWLQLQSYFGAQQNLVRILKIPTLKIRLDVLFKA